MKILEPYEALAKRAARSAASEFKRLLVVVMFQLCGIEDAAHVLLLARANRSSFHWTAQILPFLEYGRSLGGACVRPV